MVVVLSFRTTGLSGDPPAESSFVDDVSGVALDSSTALSAMSELELEEGSASMSSALSTMSELELEGWPAIKSSIEASDEDFVYFLTIFEYKLIGEVAPLEFVSDRISDIIINKRKITLKKELEKDIYEEAKTSNTFEIYRN